MPEAPPAGELSLVDDLDEYGDDEPTDDLRDQDEGATLGSRHSTSASPGDSEVSPTWTAEDDGVKKEEGDECRDDADDRRLGDGMLRERGGEQGRLVQSLQPIHRSAKVILVEDLAPPAAKSNRQVDILPTPIHTLLKSASIYSFVWQSAP